MSFHWQKSLFPIGGGEVLADHFEDIRKLMFLIERPSAGFIDVDAAYGNYTAQNWAVSWDPDSGVEWDDGELQIQYESDFFTNMNSITEDTVFNQRPVINNKLNSVYWRLLPNPNKYHHWDFNAGRPDISAEGRWVIDHHEASMPTFEPYTMRLRTRSFLPRQTDPEEQQEPTRRGGVTSRTFDPVEQEAEHVTQDIATAHDRDYPLSYRKLTEYIKEGGEPRDTKVAEQRQYAYDPKMCEAYQDRVIRTAEHESNYIKLVDTVYIAAWTRRQGTIWDSGTSYSVGDIVHYIWSDAGYYCTTGHTNQPPPDTDYWASPAYQPTLGEEHPVYPYLGDPYWCCNGSAYELLLKYLLPEVAAWEAREVGYEVDELVTHLGIIFRCAKAHAPASTVNEPPDEEFWERQVYFDWWWDDTYPHIPKSLYDAHDAAPADWPLPCGCWRRVWRHSMGRPGSIMWPGDWGAPPQYHPDHFAVTQLTYDSISAANKRWYTVVVNPPEFTLSEEQEEALAERHDPVQIEYQEIGETVQSVPQYEIHQDLVNDLWNVLIQMDTLGRNVQLKWWYWTWSFLGGAILADTGIEAYRQGQVRTLTAAEGTNPTYELITTGGNNRYHGYRGLVRADAGAPPNYTVGIGGPSQNVSTLELREQVLNIPGSEIGTLLLRVKYTGQGYVYEADGCLVGIGEHTVFANPDDPPRWKFIGVPYTSSVMDGDHRRSFFDTELLSDWPPEWFFDFPPPPVGFIIRNWTRWTIIDFRPGNDKFCAFILDREKVPVSVFERDISNVIEVGV